MLKKKCEVGRGLRGDLGKKEGVRPARGGELIKGRGGERGKVRTSLGLEIKQSIFLCIKSCREVASTFHKNRKEGCHWRKQSQERG